MTPWEYQQALDVEVGRITGALEDIARIEALTAQAWRSVRRLRVFMFAAAMVNVVFSLINLGEFIAKHWR